MVRNRNRDDIFDEPKRGGFDLFTVIKYLFFCGVFSGIIYAVKSVVMSVLASSPTGMAGNNIVSLSEVHNQGAAFNLFQNQPEMIIIASFLTVAILAFSVLVFSSKLSHNAISSIAFLTSGIVMNMLERTSLGYVVDYIHLGIIKDFPVFNMADIMIVAGAIGIILSVFGRKQL